MTETAFRTFGDLLGVGGVLLVAYELDAAIGQYSSMDSAVRRAAAAFAVSGAGSRRCTAAWSAGSRSRPSSEPWQRP